jgi:hypothetical protein
VQAPRDGCIPQGVPHGSHSKARTGRRLIRRRRNVP